MAKNYSAMRCAEASPVMHRSPIGSSKASGGSGGYPELPHMPVSAP